MRAIDELFKNGIQNFTTPNDGSTILRTIQVTSIEVTPTPELGTMVGSFAVAGTDPFKIYLWPGLYPTTDYTYTNNNNRTHTPTSTQEVLTPPLFVGDILRMEFMFHPTLDISAWIDTNRTARQWAEIPT